MEKIIYIEEKLTTLLFIEEDIRYGAEVSIDPESDWFHRGIKTIFLPGISTGEVSYTVHSMHEARKILTIINEGRLAEEIERLFGSLISSGWEPNFYVDPEDGSSDWLTDKACRYGVITWEEVDVL